MSHALTAQIGSTAIPCCPCCGSLTWRQSAVDRICDSRSCRRISTISFVGDAWKISLKIK